MMSQDMVVAVAMSGGVDSSVAALLLHSRGTPSFGLFMKNWDDGDGECPAALDYEDATAVSAKIGINCYSFNFSREYWDGVFQHFLADLQAGYTPNPDILCNREIKFKVLWEKAQSLGATHLATGHYARIANVGGEWRLLRGIDSGKDQSYFLYTLTGELLPHILFPIGDMPKSEVRALARSHGLITSDKKDSVGICFIGKRNFKEFVARYIAYHPGDIITMDGVVVGRHSGVAYYTIGQRHGLAIGGPGEPYFVVDKDVEKNQLIVVQGGNHPALFHRALMATELSWVNAPAEGRCSAKIRYRHPDQPCHVTLEGNNAYVLFDEPQRAVTPGQAVVFYNGECCLGGGTIRKVMNSR